MYTVAYHNCLKRFFDRSKYCLNRVVYGWVGLPIPGTLLFNARINAFKNITTCTSHNAMAHFIFGVFDGYVCVCIIHKCFILVNFIFSHYYIFVVLAMDNLLFSILFMLFLNC